MFQQGFGLTLSGALFRPFGLAGCPPNMVNPKKGSELFFHLGLVPSNTLEHDTVTEFLSEIILELSIGGKGLALRRLVCVSCAMIVTVEMKHDGMTGPRRTKDLQFNGLVLISSILAQPC